MALKNKLPPIFVQSHRRFSISSILKPHSDKDPLLSTGKNKALIALSRLRAEKNPERIIHICRAFPLTPDSHLDRAAHYKALSKLKDLNYFDGIRNFLEESKARPDLKSERRISHIVTLYGKAGMTKDAVKTFEEMHQMGLERTVKTLNTLLFACFMAKDFKEMKRVSMDFPRVYGISPDLDTYNWMIKGFSEAGEASSNYKILDEIKREGFKPNWRTFGGMLSGFYKEEKFEDVEHVLAMMEEHGLGDQLSTYNTRILGLCKLRKSREAKLLFEEMLSGGAKPRPNTFTYSHLILGFCKEGDLEEAKILYERMVKSGIKPECECYFILVYYLCQGRDFEAALEICRDCMKRGLVPSISSLELLVDGLASISKVDEARGVIEKLKKKFSRNAHKWIELEGRLPK